MGRMLSSAVLVDYEAVIICPACQRLAGQTTDKFCEECGTVLAKAAQRRVVCSCTPARVLGNRYCPACGTSTEVLAQRAAAEQVEHAARPGA